MRDFLDVLWRLLLAAAMIFGYLAFVIWLFSLLPDFIALTIVFVIALCAGYCAATEF